MTEKFLGLSEEEIEKRKKQVIAEAGNNFNLDYLKKELGPLECQPWKFLSYVAKRRFSLFYEALGSYLINENIKEEEKDRELLEPLRKKYVLESLIKDFEDAEQG